MLLVMLHGMISQSAIAYCLECSSCAKHIYTPSGRGVECCHQISAIDILAAITLGVKQINLPQPLAIPVQPNINQFMPLTHEQMQGQVMADTLHTNSVAEILRLSKLRKLQGDAAQIIPATTLATLYTDQYNFLPTDIQYMNAQVFGNAMQMVMLQYLIMTDTNTTALP